MESDLSVEVLTQWFEDAEHTTYDARLEAERDRDYVDGIQLTASQVAALEKRGQPPVVINRIRPKVNWLRGMEARQRTDPRAFPRTPREDGAAEAATDAIRFVCDNNEWDSVRSALWQDMLVEGYGGVEISHEQTPKGDIEIVLKFYPWDRLFYDPHSRAPDFSDARFKGAVIWADAEEWAQAYPQLREAVGQTMTETGSSDTYDDRPRWQSWGDRERTRIRLVLMHYRVKGQWRWCLFTKNMKLDGGESPYVDEDGESVCALEMQSAYVDRNNNRHGVVRDMISPQDEINKRRSKALHLSTMRQTKGTRGAVKSVAAMKRELARPDGHVEVEEDMQFEILNTNDQAAAHMALLQEAKNEIDGMGPNAALEGEIGSSASGRAVIARQQGGMMENAPLLDALRMLSKRVYRQIWMRVRQFWTEERWVRVTDDERNIRYVGLNRPVTLGEKLSQMPDEQALAIAQRLGLQPGDPRLGAVVEIENEVGTLDVDIVLDESPDVVTLQGETFETLVNLATSMPGSIPPEILIEMAPGLRRDVKDRLIELQQQMAQANAQNPASQVGLEVQQAKAMRDRAAAVKDVASAAEMQVGAPQLPQRLGA